MHNSDLVETLAVFKPEERNRLLAGLGATDEPRTDITRLVSYIFRHLPASQAESSLSEETVYAYLYPHQAWVKNRLGKLRSATLKAVRQFIAAETFTQQMSPLQQAYYLQIFYSERGLEDKFHAGYKQALQHRNQQRTWSLPEYYHYFLIEKEESVFQSGRNRKKDDLNLVNTLRALDEYYLIERLLATCMLLNQNQLTPLNLPAIEHLLPFDPASPQLAWFFEKPIGKLCLQATWLLADSQNSNEQVFRDFINLLGEHEQNLDPDCLFALEIYACNYGIWGSNKGISAYYEPVFQLQKRRVESGRIYTEDKIKASEFHSIVVIGIRLGEYDWVKRFIEQHQGRILGAMASDEYYQFNLAYYLYHIKDYEPALKTLLTSSYDDMTYKFSSKILEIKILYEKSLLPGADHRVGEFLESRVEAAIIFFFREQRLPPNRKKLGKRFADTMKRIIHAKDNHDWKHLEKIQADVQKIDVIAERQWLLDILDALIAQFKNGKKHS